VVTQYSTGSTRADFSSVINLSELAEQEKTNINQVSMDLL
jgi:hypothetical protein